MKALKLPPWGILILKSSNEFFRKLRYGDFIVISAVLIISVTLFAFSFFSSGNKLTAEISLDGETVKQVSLYTLTECETVIIGNCEILLEKDGVTFVSSECPDKLCIKSGKLKKAGDTMACLPERVAVVLRAEKGEVIDGVAF